MTSGLLKKQIDYDENANVTVIQEYVRRNDTIYINVYDGKAAFVYRNIMLTEKVSGTSLIKAMYKVDRNNNILETTILEYDQLLSLRRKMIYDDKNKGTKREFVYDDDGALLRSVTYNENNEIISDSSYEYDKYGNVIRIIEFDKGTTSTKLYFINYLSKSE
jgi:YD repeat-containing protein